MRGKSSSSSSKLKNGIIEAENPSEPHVSSAYIRSFVKQLSSSRTKDSSSKGHETSGGQANSNISSAANMSCDGLFSDQEKPHHHQPGPQQHKKQVRRRLHTSRPYQERLLNMAEARREIVTALKFHRASMKKAREEQQEEDRKAESGHGNQSFDPSPDQISIEQDAKSKSWRNPRIYTSNSSISNDFPTNHSDNFSYWPGTYYWSMPHIPPPPLYQENLNLALPSQTLGLNLNLQDFNNLDASVFNKLSSIYSSASTSSSPLNSASTEKTVGAQSVAELDSPSLHHAIDDEEMAELRSIGDLYQMEWNDTMSLANSAWWFKFLKAMEVDDKYEDKKGGDDLANSPFYDEFMEFPCWIDENDESVVNDFCCYDYSRDPSTLPCMDIEEIDRMDGDWLN